MANPNVLRYCPTDKRWNFEGKWGEAASVVSEVLVYITSVRLECFKTSKTSRLADWKVRSLAPVQYIGTVVYKDDLMLGTCKINLKAKLIEAYYKETIITI